MAIEGCCDIEAPNGFAAAGGFAADAPKGFADCVDAPNGFAGAVGCPKTLVVGAAAATLLPGAPNTPAVGVGAPSMDTSAVCGCCACPNGLGAAGGPLRRLPAWVLLPDRAANGLAVAALLLAGLAPRAPNGGAEAKDPLAPKGLGLAAPSCEGWPNADEDPIDDPNGLDFWPKADVWPKPDPADEPSADVDCPKGLGFWPRADGCPKPLEPKADGWPKADD